MGQEPRYFSNDEYWATLGFCGWACRIFHEVRDSRRVGAAAGGLAADGVAAIVSAASGEVDIVVNPEFTTRFLGYIRDRGLWGAD